MKNKYKIMLLLLSLLFFVLSTTGIYASNQEAVNEIDTGVVNIEISEYELNELGQEVEFEDHMGVLPGTRVSRIPYFTATGNDCYIRATIKVDGVVDGAEQITDEDFYGISDDWIKIGECYYYKHPLKSKDSVRFFQGFDVPNWDNSVNPDNIGNWGFSVKVTVDAVQSDNFEPKFESDAPWGDITIQESIHKDGYDINTFTASSSDMFIVIEDRDNVIVDPTNLFEGFKTVVPGDVLTDEAKISSKRKCKLYLTTESIEDIDLLQNLKLKIVLQKNNKETVVYDGILDSQIDKKLLGEFKKGETGKLIFTVSVPHELDNEYTLRHGTVKWIFTTDKGNIPDGPQTGDNSQLTLYVIIMIISGSFMILLLIDLWKRRKDDKSHEKSNRKCS